MENLYQGRNRVETGLTGLTGKVGVLPEGQGEGRCYICKCRLSYVGNSKLAVEVAHPGCERNMIKMNTFQKLCFL